MPTSSKTLSWLSCPVSVKVVKSFTKSQMANFAQTLPGGGNFILLRRDKLLTQRRWVWFGAHLNLSRTGCLCSCSWSESALGFFCTEDVRCVYWEFIEKEQREVTSRAAASIYTSCVCRWKWMHIITAASDEVAPFISGGEWWSTNTLLKWIFLYLTWVFLFLTSFLFSIKKYSIWTVL